MVKLWNLRDAMDHYLKHNPWVMPSEQEMRQKLTLTGDKIMDDEKCYPCKQHSGTIADVKTLKDSVSKLWSTVAAKISTKMFL